MQVNRDSYVAELTEEDQKFDTFIYTNIYKCRNIHE